MVVSNETIGLKGKFALPDGRMESMEPTGPVPPGIIKRATTTVKLWDDQFHNYISERWPRTVRFGGGLLRIIYAIFTSSAFAVILALLLVGFVISSEITIIVSISVYLAWVVGWLSVAKAEWVNRQRIGRRFLIVFCIAGLTGLGAHSYVQWCLVHYASNKERDEAHSGIDYGKLRKVFDDEMQKLPVQPKIDELPKVGRKNPLPTSSKPPSQIPATPPKTAEPKTAPPLPTSISAGFGQLFVSQKDAISTREDAKFLVKVTVQATTEFPNLKLLLKCNVPIVGADAQPVASGMMTSVRYGIAQADPTIFVFQYGSASPPFGPANPLEISVWAKEHPTCDQVQTF